VGGLGMAPVRVTLLSMLRRAAEPAACLAGAGSYIVPYPASVALYSLCLSC
jgi:hypothetical protein